MTEEKEEIQPFTFNLAFFIALYFIMTWFGLFPSVIAGYWYFITFPFSFDLVYLTLLIPLFFILYGLALLCALLSTKIGIWIIHKWVAYPKLGSYRYLMEDPQTRAFILKENIKNFGRWLFYFFHLTYLRKFWMRRMGVKIGKNVKIGLHVQDDDFIEISDNTFMAKNSAASGHLLDLAKITFHPTIIGKNCIFESMSGAVGATVGDNSIISQRSAAMKGNICRGNAVYQGTPLKKIGEYSDLTSTEIEELKQEIRKIDRIDFIKKENAPIKISTVKLVLLKLLIILGGCIFGFIPPSLFYLFFQTFYSSTNHLINIALLTIVPIIFLVLLGLFIFGTTLLINILLKYYDRKAEIPEGTYELDDPRAKYFKIKYCLRTFGLRLFHGTPFKIADAYALNVWGNSKAGKDVNLGNGIIDPQYLEIGANTQISSGARIHTHRIIDGKLYIKRVKLGKNVLIGGYVHIEPGVEIADGSIAGIDAWFERDQKCQERALWIGKPARKLPLEAVTHSAKLEGKYVD